MIMKKHLLALMCLFSAITHAQATFTPQQEARISDLVRETLLNNPQILAEVADKLNAQASAQGEAQFQSALQEYKDFLFNDANSPRIGAKDPDLTLVVFTDYNCPYCKKFDPYLEKIVKQYPNVAVVFKFLPYRSESSVTSARDALTVWRRHPEQFLTFNDVLMSKVGYHDDASIEAAKKKAGVIVDKPDEQSLDTVKKSLAVAEKLGIQGTPATIIGDQMLSGWVPYEQFDAMVKDALQKHQS